MNAKELRKLLENLPDDANVKALWDGEVRSQVRHVWITRDGDIVLADQNQDVFHAADYPKDIPVTQTFRTASVEKEPWED